MLLYFTCAIFILADKIMLISLDHESLFGIGYYIFALFHILWLFGSEWRYSSVNLSSLRVMIYEKKLKSCDVTNVISMTLY